MFDQRKDDVKQAHSSPFTQEVKQSPIDAFDFGFDNFNQQVNQTVVIESKPNPASSLFENWGFTNNKDEVN